MIDDSPAPKHLVDLRSTIPFKTGRLEITVSLIHCQFDGTYWGADALVRHHSPSGAYRDSEVHVYPIGPLGHVGGEPVWQPARAAVSDEVERMCLACGLVDLEPAPKRRMMS